MHIAETEPIVTTTKMGRQQPTLRELLVSKPLQYDSAKISLSIDMDGRSMDSHDMNSAADVAKLAR